MVKKNFTRLPTGYEISFDFFFDMRVVLVIQNGLRTFVLASESYLVRKQSFRRIFGGGYAGN